jgi:DNA-directed RNA polymerase
MGRDEEGAFQVNLSPSDQPSDIYTHVSKMVIKMI